MWVVVCRVLGIVHYEAVAERLTNNGKLDHLAEEALAWDSTDVVDPHTHDALYVGKSEHTLLLDGNGWLSGGLTEFGMVLAPFWTVGHC